MNVRRISARAFAVALVLLAGELSAHAQSASEGSVRGYVRDQQGGVLPGVTLTATTDAAPGVRTATSDGTGYFRLEGLLPGSYTLTATLQGFAKHVRGGVVVRAGLNLGLDLVMQVGTLDAVVDVKADTPMLETANSVQAVNVSGEFLRQVPVTTGRRWSDVLSMTPGVVSIESGTPYGAAQFLRGSTQQAIAIDGADLSAPASGQTVYVNISTEALEDTQVKTGAVDAASPLTFGAVVNMVTKSGTNTLRGAASMNYQSKKWNDQNLPGGTPATLAVAQPDVALGGPILKDRLWFFGAYRYQRRSSAVTRTASEIATVKAIYPAFEPFNNNNYAHYSFVKGTAQLGSKHQMYIYHQYDKNPVEANGALSAEPFARQVLGGPAWAANVSSVWNSSWTTRFSASYSAKGFEILQRPDVPARPVFQSVFLSGGRLVGTNQLASLDNTSGVSFTQPSWKYQLTGDSTYYRSGWLGTHEFKAGFFFQPKLHFESRAEYVNGGFTREQLVLRDPNNPAGGTVAYSRQIFDGGAAINVLTDSSDYAFYLQDNWRPTSRLTLNLGLRVDIINRTDRVFDIKTQDSTEVGPRLGVNYVLTADQRNTLHASWGRVHETVQAGNIGAGGSSVTSRDLFDLNLDGTFETVFVNPGNTTLSQNQRFDLKRGQPYMDEWMVGYRRQLPGQLTVGADFSHRDYKHAIGYYEVNGIYDNGVFRGYRDVSQNAILLITNNRSNWRVYNGLDVHVTKETKSIQLLANYGRQWRHLEGTYQPNDPASFLQPETFASDKSIGQVQGTSADANSLNGFSFWGAPMWRDHVLRLAASYSAPWRLRLATNYIVQSGMFSGPIVTRLPAADPRFGPTTVTLSNGRVVSNPLATTIRFANPTRGDGQVVSPVVHWWNLRLGRDFVVGGHRLEAAVDVFNVLNNGGDFEHMFGSNQLYNTAAYGKFTQRQPPRSGQLFVRYAF